MKITNERLNDIYDKTCGRCHLCRKALCFSNYGKTGSRGAWEIEHSKAQANGGTDHLNNLYAACIVCNRSKGKSSTQSARTKYGYRRAPRSQIQKERDAWKGAGLGSLVALFVPPPIRIATLVVCGVAGAVAAYNKEPD